MAPATKPSSLTSRENRRKANEEDIKHVLEELWDFKPEDIFYKIVSREARKGIGGFFYLTKDELLSLTWKDDDGSAHPITPNEACKIIMLLNYERHLKETGKVSSFRKFRLTSITRISWDVFVSHPDQQKLVDFYDEIHNAKPKIDEPDSFAPKKYFSPNAFRSDASSDSEELSLCPCDNFSSKDDSTSCSSSDKINFDSETFENHVFVAISDVEPVNSADESTPFLSHQMGRLRNITPFLLLMGRQLKNLLI